ncbi:MAG: 23S rRNA (guanosine(2251)-2'-O)-methyltransferase RlmB, partial [Proteobacteria bacterium]|nr:23S rRNA (guanosine(2251)-2'-O)-methyltransferase RlmB [Pseudomonadota bacterium]
MSKSKYVAGLRAVEQLLSSRNSDVRRIFAEYQTVNPRVEALISLANARGIEIQQANRGRLQQISGESRHQGIVAEVRRSTMLDEANLRSLVEARLESADERHLLLLMLDGVQDPHNLGACLRTADATGVDAVIVPRHDSAGLGSTVSKVASGAAEQ